MASNQPAQRRADLRGDIEDWMAARWADVERRGSEAEAAGREAWDRATRSGRNLSAARPGDVSALGGEVMRRKAARPSSAEAVSFTEPEVVEDFGAAIEPSGGPEFSEPQPMDLGLKFVAAQPGDGISKLLGSSDPRAIGKFQSLNGMGGSSALRAGRSYVVPTRWDDATENEIAAGHRILRADNARLAEAEARRAGTARQAQLFEEDRNIWTGEPVGAANTQPTRRGPSRTWLDDSVAAKVAGGMLAYGAGLAPGVVRGAAHTVGGAIEGARFVSRFANPLDVVLSAPGQSAREQVFELGRSVGDYARRGIRDPSMVRDDLASAFHNFRVKEDPTATPMASTFGGELRRMANYGMNDGELLFDVGSLLVGGEALRGAAGLGRAAKAAEATEVAYLGKHPDFAAYLDKPYPISGMSHHIMARRTRFPRWLGGGPLPEWFIESEFNKIRHHNIMNRDVFRNHTAVDDWYRGGRVPAKFGGGGWSAKKLGWTEYGPLDRLNYGTSPATKAVVGPVLFGGTTVDLMNGSERP